MFVPNYPALQIPRPDDGPEPLPQKPAVGQIDDFDRQDSDCGKRGFCVVKTNDDEDDDQSGMLVFSM